MKKLIVIAAAVLMSVSAQANNPELNLSGDTAEKLYTSLDLVAERDVYSAASVKRMKGVQCSKQSLVHAYDSDLENRGRGRGNPGNIRPGRRNFLFSCRIKANLSQWQLEELYNNLNILARQTRHTMTATKFVSVELSVVQARSFRPGARNDYSLIYSDLNPLPPTTRDQATVTIGGIEAQNLYESLNVEEVGGFRPGVMTKVRKSVGSLTCTKELRFYGGPRPRNDRGRDRTYPRPGPGMAKQVYECQMSGRLESVNPF